MIKGGIAHIVEYKAYSRNHLAVRMMQKAAEKYLTKAKGPSAITFGKPFRTGRAVSSTDYDFGICVIFLSSRAMSRYMKDPNHMKWVRFVLKGYQKPGSKLKTSKERNEEFIQAVLYGKEKFKWIRDKSVPNSEVVWGGETVRDFGNG